MTLLAKNEQQLELFTDPIAVVSKKSARTSTFTDNMALPIHRWFRYSAGFSSEWVAEVIRSRQTESGIRVLDPFAGSGTTLLASDAVGVQSVGFETHPFIYRVAACKTNWDVDEMEYLNHTQEVLHDARSNLSTASATDKTLLLKCYESENLAMLEALRSSYLKLRKDNSKEWELVWLTLTSILRECSGVGTAQWQYILPNKKKARTSVPFDAFLRKAFSFVQDIRAERNKSIKPNSRILLTDARTPNWDEKNYFDLVITSPPYPNNYDYADATRLEMTFWGEVSSWGDLQAVVRRYLIRSCSQHSAAEKLQLDQLLDNPVIRSIKSELEVVCRQLEEVRLTKGGKKTYHTMVAAYFVDLAKVWTVLRELCSEGATVCFVVGDSAPYGIYVPVDEWLGTLAVDAGFKEYSFAKLRDRNVKWKNRKHRVPLHEGMLWVQG